MSYALATAILETGQYDVTCAGCYSDIGVMSGPMIREAMWARGPLLCPNCRQRKCDFCGRLVKHKLPFTSYGFARICPLCVQGRKNLQPPTHYRKLIGSTRELMLNEGIIGEYCLSSSPKLNTLKEERDRG